MIRLRGIACTHSREKNKLSGRERVRPRRNNGAAPSNCAGHYPVPLIRSTIDDSIRRYWVHGEKDRDRLSGWWTEERKRERERESGVSVNFGHGLSITNPPTEFRPINLCKRRAHLCSSSPSLSLSLYSFRTTLLSIPLRRWLSIGIEYSSGVRCPKARISPVNAYHRRPSANAKLIVIHVRLLSHVFR